MVTKHEQTIITTSNIEEMKGFYLAERLFRTWKENFVDEDKALKYFCGICWTKIKEKQ